MSAASSVRAPRCNSFSGERGNRQYVRSAGGAPYYYRAHAYVVAPAPVVVVHPYRGGRPFSGRAPIWRQADIGIILFPK